MRLIKGSSIRDQAECGEELLYGTLENPHITTGLTIRLFLIGLLYVRSLARSFIYSFLCLTGDVMVYKAEGCTRGTKLHECATNKQQAESRTNGGQPLRVETEYQKD